MDHKELWIGMPEFTQEAKKPYQQLIVRFRNEEDVQEFANLIGQKITNKTKSLWHPILQRGLDNVMVWTNEQV